MSTATLAPDPAATGLGEVAGGNTTASGNMTMPMPTGVAISAHAAQLSRVFYGVTSTLMLLAIIAFVTRVYQRVRPVWKVGADDYFIVVGFCLTVADWVMLFPMMVPQPGEISFARSGEAGKNSWLAIGIWGLSMTCIKLSIALTLLRIQGKEKWWRVFLYTLMVVQFAYGIGNTLFNLVIACRPLEAAWNPFLPGGKCVSYGIMRGVSNLGSGINITTDVLLSLAPATFLWKLNRPLRERIFIAVLMGMGLFASVTSIVKTVIVKDWGDPMTNLEWWAQGVSISTWTVLEQQLGLLAACVPAMKGIFQKCLGVMGVSLTENKSQGRSGYYPRGGTGPGVSGMAGDPNSTFRSQNQDNFRPNQRFSRKMSGKEMYDDETVIDLAEISRNGSTKSIESRSDNAVGEMRGHSVEQLRVPAHGV